MKLRAIGLLLATLVGCGSGAGTSTDGAGAVDSTEVCPPPGDAVAPPAGLEATAALGDSQRGRAIQASLMLRNGGEESIEPGCAARRLLWPIEHLVSMRALTPASQAATPIMFVL